MPLRRRQFYAPTPSSPSPRLPLNGPYCHQRGGRLPLNGRRLPRHLQNAWRVHQAHHHEPHRASETVRLPDPLHRAQGDTDRPGDGAAGPVRGFARRFRARQCEDLRHRLRRQRRLARLARLVAQQAVHPRFREPLLPAPHRRPADPDLAGHREHGQPLRRQQNNPCPLNVLLRTVPIADDGGQSRPVLGSNDDADGLCHAPQHRTASPFCESSDYVSALASSYGRIPAAPAKATDARQVDGAGAMAPSI